MSRKTLYFDGCCGYVVYAAAENGKLIEFTYEKSDVGTIVGNVYKGRVVKVLPGMQAAFVDCGLERNCYLSAKDMFRDAEKYGALAAVPQLLKVKEGDEVLVQVIKAPVGGKGARVTTNLAFISKSLIYLPVTPFVGVSRKIADEELRKNLTYSAECAVNRGEGLIVRTAAPYASRNDKQDELGYLRGLYASVMRAFGRSEVGTLLYSDFSLPVRILRDTLLSDVEKIVVGNGELEALVMGIVNLSPPHMRRPVVLHDSGRDMFDELGLAAQVNSIVSPRVDLDNGAYLVIEKTEALTVIDVNTGKFTGEDNLEQTVYYTNIMAAREIARQARLRNIGGIVVVDFIDMNNPVHRQALVEELERSLSSDAAGCCSVSPMSKFGLVEFTRKRTGVSMLAGMTAICRNCAGAGFSKSLNYIGLEVRAKLLELFASGADKVRVDAECEVIARLCEWKALWKDLKSRRPEAAVYGVPHKSYPDGQIAYGKDISDLPSAAVKLL